MTPRPDEPLPADVIAATGRGEKIEAIRLLRERTGIGLKEAKAAWMGGWTDMRLELPAVATTLAALARSECCSSSSWASR